MNLCMYPPHTHNLPAELMHSRCDRVLMILTDFGARWPAKGVGQTWDNIIAEAHVCCELESI